MNNIWQKFFEEKLVNLRIAVIGDVLLDRYVFGEVKRISPEAPVPVHLVKKTKTVPGGAANVVNNLYKMDCQVSLFSITGNDSYRIELDELLMASKINLSGLISDVNRQTTVKVRFFGGHQQMLRVDFERIEPISEEQTKDLLQALKRNMQNGLDGIVISDYGKGVCTPKLCKYVIEIAQKENIPILVDPKSKDWSIYQGADYLTPNMNELSAAYGKNIPNEDEFVFVAGQEMCRRYGIKNLIITRSEKGATLIDKDGHICNHPATAKEVFDVSGAGDTVAAALITSFAVGLSPTEALQLANRAAGIVVSKVGTYPVHREELISLWQNEYNTNNNGKIFSSKELASKVKEWQSKGEVVVFTNGCFDILHAGHISYLSEAAKIGDRLIIGVNSDSSVRKLKDKSRPIIRQEDRASLLESLSGVDGVVIFTEDTPAELLAELRPNILVKGGDYKSEDVVGREYVDSVKIISFKKGYSTTEIINKILNKSKEKKQ